MADRRGDRVHPTAHVLNTEASQFRRVEIAVDDRNKVDVTATLSERAERATDPTT